MTIERPVLPLPGPASGVPAHLEKLVETTAKDYARGATQRAYAADWRHYTA
jgi:hypothetical protein